MIEPIPSIGSMSLGFGNAPPVTPAGEGEELKTACKDFVSTLYAYVFEQMRSSENDEDGESLFGGQEASMFMGFLDQDVGQSIAGQEGSELPNLLYQQLTDAQKEKQKIIDEKK